jgi:oligosaccharide repeat unit polymerase
MEQIVTAMPLLLLFITWGRCIKTYFSPCGIMTGIWSIFLIIHLLIVPNYKFSYTAGFIIDVLIIFFFLGEFTIFIASNKFNRIKKGYSFTLKIVNGKFEKRLRMIIIALGLISFIGSLLYFRVFYIHFGSFQNLFTAGWFIRQELGEGLINVPLSIRIMALTAYSNLVLSLIYWIYFKFRWFLTIPCICILLMGIAQAGRGGTYMMLITIFFAGYWRDKLYGTSHVGYKLFRRIVIFSISIIVIFTLGLAYREQSFGTELFLYQQIDTYKSYACGAISAFSVFWDKHSLLDTDLTLGLYSFSSLFELLGIEKLPSGFYDEYLYISNINNEVTNNYTLFRPALEDFGLSALAYMFLLGAVFSYVFRYASKGNTAALAFIIVAYTMLAFSIIAPLTQHNTILLGFIMPSFILHIITNERFHLLPTKRP